MIRMLEEHWLEIVALTGFVVQAGGVYWLLRERLVKIESALVSFKAEAFVHWKALEIEMVRIELKLDAHITSPSPHPMCPAHTAKIEDILDRLDRVQIDIREVRTCVMDMPEKISVAMKRG